MCIRDKDSQVDPRGCGLTVRTARFPNGSGLAKAAFGLRGVRRPESIPQIVEDHRQVAIAIVRAEKVQRFAQGFFGVLLEPGAKVGAARAPKPVRDLDAT